MNTNFLEIDEIYIYTINPYKYDNFKNNNILKF